MLIRIDAISIVLLCLWLGMVQTSQADEPNRLDERFAFRTDFSNSHLPWYVPRTLEFPPSHSDHRVGGELVQIDAILRQGAFRRSKTGELVRFTLPPYGTARYLNAEADLRDLRLGTYYLFFLHSGSDGQFTQLATMADQFTIDASHQFLYRLDRVDLESNRLFMTKYKGTNTEALGQKELAVSELTQYWKGNDSVRLRDLKPGDEILFNQTAATADRPSRATEIWIGSETWMNASAQQWARFEAFTKDRGVPGWIDKTVTEGKELTITFFSTNSKHFKEVYRPLLTPEATIAVETANHQLRTWNPVVSAERGKILSVREVPVSGYGCSGIQVTVAVNNLIEGFRKGRICRVFLTGWPLQDQYYGETLMNYGYHPPIQIEELKENLAELFPRQFPYRTDYSNADLSWFQLASEDQPRPAYSEHVVYGELIETEPSLRQGKFRDENSGDVLNFSLLQNSDVNYLNCKSRLEDIPTGTRCRWCMYQDKSGEFTLVSKVDDDFSYMASNKLLWRIESLLLDEGKIFAARQLPEVKTINHDVRQPPDSGRSELLFTPQTRFWKQDKAITSQDLQVGDHLLVNRTGESPGAPSHCTDIWVGTQTHRLVSERQSNRLPPSPP